MSDIDFQNQNDDPIVVEEPKDATWAKVDSYSINREEGRAVVTITGELPATNCRLLIYLTGTRRHLTYRILQQCTGIGGDVMVPFSATVGLGAMDGTATFLDGEGELQVRTPFLTASRGEGEGASAKLTSDIDRPFPLGKAEQGLYAAAAPVTVTGTLTDEGIECRAMREEATDKLYTLTPASKLSGFKNGERVTVIGTIAQVSFCMQGTTLSVQSVSRA